MNFVLSVYDTDTIGDKCVASQQCPCRRHISGTISYIRPKAQIPLFRFVVDCCEFAVQQIHNTSAVN